MVTLTINRISEVLSAVSGRHVSPAQIRPIMEIGAQSQLPDSTLKFFVTLGSIDGFLIVSGAGNHSLVSRAVANIEQARALSGSAAIAIIPPILAGNIDGRSFAVWNCEKPFPSGKIVGNFVRFLYGKKILDWGVALCANSVAPPRNIENQFIRPLLEIRDSDTWPLEMRRAAGYGLERIGIWKPMQCVQHGDFWIGNVLRSRDGGLAVVDWAGAITEGYPVFDLARMLISLNCKSRTKTHYMKILCDILSCETIDLVSYSLAAIGNIGMRLEYFPIDQYRKMGLEVHQYLADA